MSSSKFRKALAEAKTTVPARVAIPQVDPGEPAQPTSTDQARRLPGAQPAGDPPVHDLIPATPVDPRMRPVDTAARVVPFGSHIYPDRHKQVLYEAFMSGVKPWEVLETALAEYFQRRYGDPPPSNVM